MATPDFILELRRMIGSHPLPLTGVTAVVIRDEHVLLGRRSDTGALTPITGIIDPGEEPAVAAARETLEEAGIVCRVEHLAWVHQIPRITFGNGDQADFLDLTFRCSWISGDPAPLDGEMTEVGWFDTRTLPPMGEDMRRRVEAALTASGPARFESS